MLLNFFTQIAEILAMIRLDLSFVFPHVSFAVYILID